MGNFICSKTESTIDPSSFRKQPTQMMNYEKAQDISFDYEEQSPNPFNYRHKDLFILKQFSKQQQRKRSQSVTYEDRNCLSESEKNSLGKACQQHYQRMLIHDRSSNPCSCPSRQRSMGSHSVSNYQRCTKCFKRVRKRQKNYKLSGKKPKSECHSEYWTFKPNSDNHQHKDQGRPSWGTFKDIEVEVLSHYQGIQIRHSRKLVKKQYSEQKANSEGFELAVTLPREGSLNSLSSQAEEVVKNSRESKNLGRLFKGIKHIQSDGCFNTELF